MGLGVAPAIGVRVRVKSKTRWHDLGPAGAPEAAFSVRSCLRLPRASASLGQSATCAALAPRPYRPWFPHSMARPGNSHRTEGDLRVDRRVA